MKKVVLGLFFLISTYAHNLRAEEQFIYTRVSDKEGLASRVNTIYKEPDGDIWLGTPDGLYTFNGHDLYHNNDPLLAGRIVVRIEEDKEGSIWVLTDNWLMRRAEGEEGFTLFTAESHRKQTAFYSMCHDEDCIWFGSYGSIYKYDFSNREFSRFCQPAGLEHFTCLFLNKTDDSTLLCGSNMGSFYVNTETGEFTQASLEPIKEISCTMTDSMDRLWIAYYNHGIRVYDKDGTLIKKYTTGNSALSNNIVICLTEKDGKVWAGTDGGGINIIDPDTDGIKVLANVPGDPSSFPAHSIKTLYADIYGNMWTGTTRDGLILISQSEMKTYSESQLGLSSGLSNKTVLSLFQEKGDDSIWIGTDCEGINRFDPKTKTFTHYDETFKTKIVSMATYSETELALSVYSEGIWLFDKNTGAVRPLKLNEEEIKHTIRYTGRSVIIANGKDDDIYFLRQVVQKYDRETGLCRTIPVEEGKRSRGHMHAIGTSEKGLYLHDTNGIYRIDEDNEVLLQLGVAVDEVIHSGFLGKDGDIWLATQKGLCRFNENTGAFSYISTGLFSEATSVVCDNQSRVWVGAGANLYAYLSDEDSFAMFGESDGAPLNEYIARPRLLSNDGDVYMGGVQGFLTIGSDYVIDASEEPVIRLHSIRADRRKIYADRKGTYEVPRNSKFLSISVSAQETDIFRNKMYRFSFSGGGNDYELRSPTLEIQDLPKPGRYEVKVSCTKRNGDWSMPYSIMKIRIPQPWYRTGWFICLCLSLMTITIGSAVTVMMNRRRSSRQLAIKEQEQHVYEEKVKMLINISHELRTPLTLIMAPLKRLIKETYDRDKTSATLKRIYRQSVRMRDLLNMVLDLRKMEVGKNRLKLEDIDFNRWISETTHDFVTEGRSGGIDIVLELSDAAGSVRFDRQKCEAVMMNIMSNAIKHSSKGDVITISTTLTAEGMVRTSISDEGPGLRDIDHEKMFTRFYQSNSEQYGSGIGLSYSKILVELHGGRIGAENNEVKGATFWWEIPVRNTAEDLQTPARAYLNEIIGNNPADDITIPEGVAFSIAEKKIMLVDDNPDLLEFLREAMNADFGEIMTATGGEKAFRMISEGMLPDIIVSDVNMPEGDGYTLCSRLKSDERYIHIPIILLTARGEEQSQGDVYKVGADAYMAKPFETETLTELIRNLLRRKENIRKRYFDNEGEAAVSYGSTEEGFILRLNAVIAEHLSDPELDQQLLCRELGVSRASLYNKMKAITGSGAKEYITRIRLEKAKSLIENSSCTIAEISDMTGFASQSYFSTAFKNYTGMTPSQYKQECRK